MDTQPVYAVEVTLYIDAPNAAVADERADILADALAAWDGPSFYRSHEAITPSDVRPVGA